MAALVVSRRLRFFALQRHGGRLLHGSQYNTSVSPWLGQLTRKCFLDIHHLSGARLHETKVVLSAPLQSISCGDLPDALQIALVTCDDADWQDLVLLHPVLSFHINHLGEVLQRLEGAGLGDVIDQEESVAFQIRLRPKAAVFLLASGVC